MYEELSIDELKNIIVQKYPTIEFYEIEIDQLVFEDRVKMKCFYCKNYNYNWKCPPQLPDKIDYKKMFAEYDNGMFVKISIPFNQDNFAEVRSTSTNHLHRALLEMEEWLWNHNHPLALSFIGGSCKLCKNGCGKERCNNPYIARTPLEATGVNVISSARKYDIDITFPPTEQLMRVGLLLW